MKFPITGLDNWLKFPWYPLEEEIRLLLKHCFLQVQQMLKVQTMLNNSLLSLLEIAFPEINRLFSNHPRDDGIENCSVVHRSHSKKVLVAFAGTDAPPDQSGQRDPSSRKIFKRGASSLRRPLLFLMREILQKAPADEPVFQFMDEKRGQALQSLHDGIRKQVPAHLLRFREDVSRHRHVGQKLTIIKHHISRHFKKWNVVRLGLLYSFYRLIADIIF